MTEEKKISTREAYGRTLETLGAKYPNIVVLDADLVGATKTGYFQKSYPDRHFDCGIAEANMMGVAAGLPAAGPRAQGIVSLPESASCGRGFTITDRGKHP